jgi:hypothetical protein
MKVKCSRRRWSRAYAFTVLRAGTVFCLVAVPFCAGCSRSPGLNPVEKEALASLERDYGVKQYKMDEQNRVTGINLERSNIDDQAMEHVLKFKMLTYLSVRRSSITDAGMEALHGLPRLASLNIASTAVSDRGLAQLERCDSLRDIWLMRSDGVTVRGISSLKRAIPGLRIHEAPLVNKAKEPSKTAKATKA